MVNNTKKYRLQQTMADRRAENKRKKKATQRAANRRKQAKSDNVTIKITTGSFDAKLIRWMADTSGKTMGQTITHLFDTQMPDGKVPANKGCLQSGNEDAIQVTIPKSYAKKFDKKYYDACSLSRTGLVELMIGNFVNPAYSESDDCWFGTINWMGETHKMACLSPKHFVARQRHRTYLKLLFKSKSMTQAERQSSEISKMIDANNDLVTRITEDAATEVLSEMTWQRKMLVTGGHDHLEEDNLTPALDLELKRIMQETVDPTFRMRRRGIPAPTEHAYSCPQVALKPIPKAKADGMLSLGHSTPTDVVTKDDVRGWVNIGSKADTEMTRWQFAHGMTIDDYFAQV